VAVKDRKYRLEVGYGLEATLPDSLVGSIGREYLVPNFRKGDFAGGIVAAVTEIAKTSPAAQQAAKPGKSRVVNKVAPHPRQEPPARTRTYRVSYSPSFWSSSGSASLRSSSQG